MDIKQNNSKVTDPLVLLASIELAALLVSPVSLVLSENLKKVTD